MSTAVEQQLEQPMPLSIPQASDATLRDWFAAKAMQGLIASNDPGAGDRIDDIPEYAYWIADAMLAERAK
jgi:hypothetical protein